MVTSDLVSGIIIAITLIIDIFKKYGGRSFRLIIFTDSGTSTIPDHFLPVLEELIDMVKNLPFSIDFIGINLKAAKESKKMKNLVQRSGGEFLNISNIDSLKDKLMVLADKKEYGDLETLDKTAISKYEEEQTFYASYENVALEPLPVKKATTCTICFKKWVVLK